MSLSARLQARDSENRHARERLIWRFRFGAAIFCTIQTAVDPGDSVSLSWIIIGVFCASVVASKLVIDRSRSCRVIRRLGVGVMGIDWLLVCAALANDMTDPAAPTYLITVLTLLESTMRWPRYGGAVGGVTAGLAAGGWTMFVYDRIDRPLELGFATLRFGVLLVIGVFFGALTRRLSDQHRALERILDTSRDLIVTLDPAGTVLAVNAACESVLGWRTTDVVGRDCREFLDAGQIIDLEDAALLSRIAPGEEPMLALRRFHHADGTLRWLELSVSSDPGTGIFYVTGRDVTYRLAVERQVSMSEQRFRSLFDQNADAVYSFDVHGTFTAANPVTERLTGYSETELCDSTFEHLIAPDHREHTLRRFRFALAGEPQNYDTVVLAKDGHRIDFNITNLPIIVDDEVVGVFGVAKDVTQRRRLERELVHQARHDSLTGLPNRLALEELLDRELSARSVPATLLFVDLDRFKIVNDSLGHRCGDELLVLVVGRLAACLRDADVLVRWAGDEFCILLEGETSEPEALAVADRLLCAIAQPFLVSGRDIRLSASIGLAHSAPGDTPERLVQMADMAMYEAKRAGRNQLSIHQRDQLVVGSNPIDFEMELRDAIENRTFRLDYQPIVELATGRIVAVESLIRWPLPDGSVRPPGDFIGVAEDCGLIRPITSWVIGEVCRQLAAWDLTTGTTSELRGWVNISGVDLQDPRLVAEIVDALQASSIEAGRLVLEVTESTLLQDLEQVDRTVDSLRRLGVSLAIDDFGTGYSSMTQLHRLRVAACKIDRSFVAGAPTCERDAAIIQSLTDLASVFDFDVVGEGVETPEQLRVLQEVGCALAQGYLLGRPSAPEDLVARLALGHLDLARLVHWPG